MAYKAIIITAGSEDFSKAERESLWKQEVDLDDWDYMILLEDPDGSLLGKESKWNNMDSEWYPNDYEWYPNDYELSRLLNGCCSNRWHKKIKFRGKIYTVGVAYHA